MSDAVIRIRLDASDAKRSLADLRNDMSRTTAEAGGIGVNLRGGGGGGIGSMGLGQLAQLGAGLYGGHMVTRNLTSGLHATTQGLTEGLSGWLEQAIANNTFSGIKGDLAALQQLKQSAALAVGYGADPASFQGLFNALSEREGKRASGELELQVKYGGDIAQRTLTALGERIAELLGKLVDKINIFGGPKT